MYIGIIPFILFIVFLYNFKKDPRKITNGFLFNIFLCSFLLFCIIVAAKASYEILYFIVIIPLIVIILAIPFGIFVLIFGLFLNAKILMRKEGRRFTTSLTLILAVGILTLILLAIIEPSRLVSIHLQPIFGGISLIIFYFFIHMLNFLTAYFLYQFNKPKLNQDFIIVLGSGLINDKVPPLLASRINKAIDFYCKQTAVTTSPKIIFSGGQGPDESLSEAEAMQKYAIERGIPIEDTIQEKRSVNTYQNMLFSKLIMDKLKPNGEYSSIFITNNFHLFRAGIYARQVNLNSQGIGSKTALYYWPNAMVREYIAFVVMKQKRHIKIISLIIGISIFFSICSFLFV